MTKQLIKEAKRFQELAGIKKLNENESPIFDITLPEGNKGRILLSTDYNSYKDEIDADIAENGWESDVPKESLTWYKTESEDGEIMWYDEDELYSDNI
jgi:hypothetical protein